ncbi:tyrosine-type recombinase/integrase [Avibacterium paragallinarum]|uniref:Site-specific integrase n=1 Tax=Avibacterium paragallinarum TaxID=728 RepID=A0ABU7QM84_AVIPA|nr:site-specific integrase [Avibacterium paragallinarum]
MATFTKRNNTWRAQVRKKGIVKSKSFRTKAEAVAWANRTEMEIDTGSYSEIVDIPFSEVIDRYLREITPTKRGARKETLMLYRFLKFPITQKSLKELREDDFQRWRDERLKTVSSATVLREWAVIGHIFNTAITEWKLLKNNPLKGVRKPAAPKPRTRRYSQDEIDALIYSSGFSFDELPTTATARVGAAILFAIETAMRAGEIVNLTWEHIHFEDRIAHLPKTKNGWPRDVPLSTQAIKILKLLEQIKDGESVFQLSTSLLDALFRKLKNRMMLEDLHFHDTRREALTRLAEKVDVMTLAKISGHRDLSILQNTYYAPDMKKVAHLLD